MLECLQPALAGLPDFGIYDTVIEPLLSPVTMAIDSLYDMVALECTIQLSNAINTTAQQQHTAAEGSTLQPAPTCNKMDRSDDMARSTQPAPPASTTESPQRLTEPTQLRMPMESPPTGSPPTESPPTDEQIPDPPADEKPTPPQQTSFEPPAVPLDEDASPNNHTNAEQGPTEQEGAEEEQRAADAENGVMQQPPLVYIIPPVIKPPIIQPPIIQLPIIIQPPISQQIRIPSVAVFSAPELSSPPISSSPAFPPPNRRRRRTPRLRSCERSCIHSPASCRRGSQRRGHARALCF